MSNYQFDPKPSYAWAETLTSAITNVKVYNVIAGNKRLCSQDIEKIRGKDSWKSKLFLINITV